MASADEANRRWEECRALVDQLRIENAALRAALSTQHPMIPPPTLPPGAPVPGTNGNIDNSIAPASAVEDKSKPEGTGEQQPNEGEEAPAAENKD